MSACRVNWWTALGLAVLALATAGFLAHRFGGDEGASVRAGREYGESQATMYNQSSTHEPTDAQIETWCHEGAELSAGAPIWYRGGVIQVGELDRRHFTEGCVEAYRAGTR